MKKSMNLKLKAIFCFSSLLVTLPSLAMADRTLRGVVTLSNPLAQAAIRIKDPSGHTLVEQSGATNETGYFTLNVPTDHIDDLRIEATDGKTHLSSAVPTNFDAENDLLHVNTATTLTERYRDLNPGTDQNTAETRVHRFLDIPGIVDFGPQIENPYLTIFSSAVLESAAKTRGGLDSYTQKLAQEMTASATATHTFATPEGGRGGIADWIAEKLASGVVEAIGSQIFGELSIGIGIPDKQSQIFDLLKQVVAQIANLQKSIDKIEKDVKEGQYNTRMQLVWDESGEINKLVANIMDQNKQALENMKDGKIVDPAIAAKIGANIKGYQAKIADKTEDFITHVNTRFVFGGDAKPIQQLYAEYLLGGIVDADYLKKLDNHIEKYRSYQVVALTLLVDSLRAQGNEPAAKTAIFVNKPLIEAVNLIYPIDRIFTLKDTLARIAKKEVLYDRNQDLLFELTYMHYDSLSQFWNYADKRPAGKPMPPSRDMTSRMLDAAGVSGNFEQMAKALGFAEKEAKDTKMVVTWAWSEKVHTRAGYYTEYYYAWFGNDRDPRQVFYPKDTQSQFFRVRKDKGMGDGFYALGATPVKELTK